MNADGFLFPNAVLAVRGLESRKGFPESYDVERLLAFVRAVHSGAPEVVAPRYSHATYDVLTDEVQVIRQPKVLLIEGVVVLTAVGSVCDVTVYVHADERTIEDWYRARFHALVEAARRDASSYSFYREFAAMTDDDFYKPNRPPIPPRQPKPGELLWARRLRHAGAGCPVGDAREAGASMRT